MQEKSIKMKEYTKVTTILSPFSGLSLIDKNILEHAANRGTFVHKICNSIILGFPYEINLEEANDYEKRLYEEASPYVESFKKWYQDDFDILMPERINCDDLGITGEFDGIKGTTLYDIKTSCNVSKTWPLQLSAYAYLARKKGIKVEKIQIIHLKKNGKEPKVIDYEENFPLFIHCYEVYKEFFKGSSPVDYKELI